MGVEDGEGGFVNGDCIGKFGFDEVGAGFGLETGGDEPGHGQVGVGGFVDSGLDRVLADFDSGLVDFEDSFGNEIAVGVEGGFGLGVVGLGLDKLDVAEIHLDETGVGGLCLETATGVGEGRFGLGFDNGVGFVDEFGGLDLDKHVDVAGFDIGGGDVHGVYGGIGHVERVSSPYSCLYHQNPGLSFHSSSHLSAVEVDIHSMLPLSGYTDSCPRL